MINKVKKPLLLILGIYLICQLVKDFEFLVLKTDQTFLAENIICKLFAIGMIFFCLHKLRISWNSIGFKRSGMIQSGILGLSLGIVTFSISYFVEYLILKNMGLHPQFAFYIANFTISNQNVIGLSMSALIICILGNIVNVWAEEGLFRGVLFQIGKMSYTQKTANLIQSLLFGLWHVITVVIWVLDGSIDIPTAFIMSIGYIALAGILGYEWGLCMALTGTIWAGVFEHFFNNFISNTLHVITETGIDELQIIRIVISNILSLLGAILLTKARKHHKSKAFNG